MERPTPGLLRFLPAPSLRRRLVAVTLLALVACAVIADAMMRFARTTAEQRHAQANDLVTREVERLAQLLATDPTPQTRLRGKGGVGLMRSGFLDAALREESGDSGFNEEILRARAEAADESARSGALAVGDATRFDGTTVVVGALALESGGYAWAAFNIVRGQQGLRASVVVLAAVMLLLLLVALQTLWVFERGVSSIRASLRALGVSRTATVERPRLSELSSIAAGVDTLARELAQKERLAALGKVVAGVAHEVRNPLTAMKLRVDLARPRVDPTFARDLGIIAEEIARLDRFVSDLLAAGGQRLGARARVSLADVARQRAELLGEWSRARGASIEVAGDASALVDADAIARVFDNLLRNAVEASPSGGAVRVAIAAIEGGASFTVSDNGPGVPDASTDEIFEPFFTTKPRGTGLGLAVSRAIATAHGGMLSYARDDRRTRFTLTLRDAE